MRARFVRVTTAVLTGLALPLVATAPALARLDDGQAPTHTGWLFVVLIYIGIPLGFFLLLATLTYAPSVRRRPRYRPTRDWQADAVWFNGPVGPEHALASTSSVVVRVVAQVPAGEAFSERDLREIGREVREISDEAQVVFSVLVADPADLRAHGEQPGLAGVPADVRAFAEQAHAAIGARSRESVLVLVAPNARRVEIVTGSALRGRLSDRDCALAALSMTSSFSGGDLAGGILQGVRMLGQRAGKPRRLPSTVSPGRTLSAILKP